ncbi:MAG: hypothetical protein B7Y75_05965, partial [Azorhizobium sp. 35-67-5]
MHLTVRAALLLAALVMAGPASATGVTVRGTEILLDGRPFIANGAAGRGRLTELKAIGGGVIRTY